MIKNNTILMKTSIFLLVLFNIAFPKGGIKVSGTPLTWGIILLLLVGMAVLFKRIYQMNLKINENRFFILSAWLPFQILCLIFLYENGYSSTGFILSYLFNLYVLPYLMLWVLGQAFDTVNKDFLFKLLRISIIFISIYGIFLFFHKLMFGEFIEIPYLTVNYDDIGTLEDKHIDRGGVFKLISTYNNGNIYGVCTLMLLPLYCMIEKNKILKLIVKISLILTLSRTVWIGLILYEIWNCFFIQFTYKKIIGFLASFIFVALGIKFAVNLIGVDFDFILDTNLGGRLEQVEIEPQMTPSTEFSGIGEIVYSSILLNFGLVGLLLYLIAITAPVVLYFFNKLNGNKELNKRLLVGYMIYIIISAADGCMLYVPTMIFFWFLVLFLTINRYVACR